MGGYTVVPSIRPKGARRDAAIPEAALETAADNPGAWVLVKTYTSGSSRGAASAVRHFHRPGFEAAARGRDLYVRVIGGA